MRFAIAAFLGLAATMETNTNLLRIEIPATFDQDVNAQLREIEGDLRSIRNSTELKQVIENTRRYVKDSVRTLEQADYKVKTSQQAFQLRDEVRQAMEILQNSTRVYGNGIEIRNESIEQFVDQLDDVKRANRNYTNYEKQVWGQAVQNISSNPLKDQIRAGVRNFQNSSEVRELQNDLRNATRYAQGAVRVIDAPNRTQVRDTVRRVTNGW